MNNKITIRRQVEEISDHGRTWVRRNVEWVARGKHACGVDLALACPTFEEAIDAATDPKTWTA